jgi:hypothetical protein
MDCQPETYITGSGAGPGLDLCEPVLFCQSFEAASQTLLHMGGKVVFPWCSDQDTWRRRTFFCLPVVRLVRSSSRYRLLDVYSDRSLAPPRMSNACSCSCALSDFNRLHASQHTFPGYRAAFPLSSASWHAPCIPNTSSSMARRPAIDRRI